jgi:hypothetical protein
MKVPATRRTLTDRLRGRSMKHRTMGRTGIEGGEVSLEDERQTRL